MRLSGVSNLKIVAATLNVDQYHSINVSSTLAGPIFQQAELNQAVSQTSTTDDLNALHLDAASATQPAAVTDSVGAVSTIAAADIGATVGQVTDAVVSQTSTSDAFDGLHLAAANAGDTLPAAVMDSADAVSTVAATDIGATVSQVADAVEAGAVLGTSIQGDIASDSSVHVQTSPALSEISEVEKFSGSDQTVDAHNPVATVINSMFETVKLPCSGLVFNNTYESDVNPNYREAIVAAENFLQQHFTDSVTLNLDFNMHANEFQKDDGSPDLSYSAYNHWDNAQLVTYDQLTAALVAHATTADDLAAVSSLPSADPSHGAQWIVPVGMAENLGLLDPSSPSMNPIDDTISLNPHAGWAFDQDAVGELIHEMTEGLFGRVSQLGYRGDSGDFSSLKLFDGDWAPMDLFRYAESANGPVHDYSGGLDGNATYFSVDGQTLLTRFHNPIDTKGTDDGADFADWASVVKGDAFGPGGPGSPGSVTDTDLRVLDILGWTPTQPLPYDSILKQVEPGAPFHGQSEGDDIILTGVIDQSHGFFLA